MAGQEEWEEAPEVLRGGSSDDDDGYRTVTVHLTHVDNTRGFTGDTRLRIGPSSPRLKAL